MKSPGSATKRSAGGISMVWKEARISLQYNDTVLSCIKTQYLHCKLHFGNMNCLWTKPKSICNAIMSCLIVFIIRINLPVNLYFQAKIRKLFRLKLFSFYIILCIFLLSIYISICNFQLSSETDVSELVSKYWITSHTYMYAIHTRTRLRREQPLGRPQSVDFNMSAIWHV